MAQFGRALRSGRRGRKFESCHLDQNQKRKARPSFFDFRLKIIDLSFSNAKHLIVLRPKNLQLMIHLGAKQGSESCHLDQNQKRKARPSFFDFRLKIIDLSFSNAKHLIVLRPKNLQLMIHLGAKQGSESCHLDQKMRYGWLIPLYRISSLRPPVHNISFASQRSVLR